MKSKLGVLGLLLTLTAVSAEMRTWTFERSGKTIKGEVVGFAADSVTLKTLEGKSVSVPIAYLIEKDRVYLAAEKAKQWKEVEILTLEGAAGRYKKCTVRGNGLSGEVFVALLPAPVESVLNERKKMAAQIAQSEAWIEDSRRALRYKEAAVHDANMANLYNPNAPLYYVRDTTRAQIEDAEQNLPKLKAAYADFVNKTKAATTVTMKKTALVYEGLPVWECLDPRKRAP